MDSISNTSKRHTLTDGEGERLRKLIETRSSDPRLDSLTLSYIERVSGKKWKDESVLEKIRLAITAQKKSYWEEGERRVVQYKGGYRVLGYMAYQMPGYVAEFSEFFLQLLREGLIQDHLRILDVGAGPGTVAIAVARVLELCDGVTAEVVSLERSEVFREAYQTIVPAFVKAAGDCVAVPRPIAADITEVMPDGEFDLIVCSNVINELGVHGDAKTDLMMRLSERLVPDGNLVLLEPADLLNATMLRDLSRDMERRGLTLYAPCNDIRGVHCTVSPCWTFATYAAIRPTKLMFALGGKEEKFRFVNTDIKFSYAVLRKDGNRRCGYHVPAATKRARFSQLKKHVGKRIHVTVSVMSAEIGDAKNYLYLVCDGTGDIPAYVVLPAHHRSPKHEALLSAPYGAVVAIDSVLVRFNAKQSAYNLLMGPESFTRLVVGAAGPSAPDKIVVLKEKCRQGSATKNGIRSLFLRRRPDAKKK
ncbi:MAG TPA: class I SAM-dependent methyltransferase [Methanocorpusculum sp.]|nr:class I SAM-dependent methyltransferase [Methanocorpusculum sp.]